MGSFRPGANRESGAIKRIITEKRRKKVERDCFSPRSLYKRDDGRGRYGLAQEPNRAVTEQSIRSAGVPRVNLVVAGVVDHARPQSISAIVALRTRQGGVAEHIAPRATTARHWFGAPVHRQPIHFRLVNLPQAVVTNWFSSGLGHKDRVRGTVGHGQDWERAATGILRVIQGAHHLGTPRILRRQPEAGSECVLNTGDREIVRPSPDLTGRGYVAHAIRVPTWEAIRPATVAVWTPAGVVIVECRRGRVRRTQVGFHYGHVSRVRTRVRAVGRDVGRVELRHVRVQPAVERPLLDVGQ